eukprot:7053886-Prymnesium_polylepis.1
MTALRSGEGSPPNQRCRGSDPSPMKSTAAMMAGSDQGTGNQPSICVEVMAMIKQASSNSSRSVITSGLQPTSGSVHRHNVEVDCQSKTIAPIISCQKRDGRR